jgi:hypothetical protein
MKIALREKASFLLGGNLPPFFFFLCFQKTRPTLSRLSVIRHPSNACRASHLRSEIGDMATTALLHQSVAVLPRPRRARALRARRVPGLVRAVDGEGDEAGTDDDKPPPGCSRYSVRVKKPLGLVLEEDKQGNIFVAEIVGESPHTHIQRSPSLSLRFTIGKFEKKKTPLTLFIHPYLYATSLILSPPPLSCPRRGWQRVQDGPGEHGRPAAGGVGGGVQQDPRLRRGCTT